MQSPASETHVYTHDFGWNALHRWVIPALCQKTERLSLVEFYSGQQPDNPAASVVDYCTGVFSLPCRWFTRNDRTGD